MHCLLHRQALASASMLAPFADLPCTRNFLSPDAPVLVSGMIKCIQSRRAKGGHSHGYYPLRAGELSSNGLSSFEEAVKLFNKREYYACHDLLESLWFESYDPLRILLHALLQCAVAFYHLSNQNHKGAMMEMGEGLMKLRKLRFEEGPFYQFEQEISTVLNFIYQTQLELAACNEDFCITMEQTERSYKLLEGFGAGQSLYSLEDCQNDGVTYIVFDPQKCYGAIDLPPTRVKLPMLEATLDHLMACQNY